MVTKIYIWHVVIKRATGGGQEIGEGREKGESNNYVGKSHYETHDFEY